VLTGVKKNVGLVMTRDFLAAAIAIALFTSPLQAKPRLVTFTVPGADNTEVVGINDKGEIAGDWNVGAVWQGFIRSKNGTITTFNVPGDQEVTRVAGINRKGEIVGTFGDRFGYVRAADGTFTTYSTPKGNRIAPPAAMNDVGWVAGEHFAPHTTQYVLPFVRSPHGRVRMFSVPGTRGAEVVGINGSGVVTGNAYGLGFVREPDGSIATFNVGAVATYPSSINAAGVVAGTAQDSGIAWKGFVRAADGSVTTFVVPGSSSTLASGMNANGAITGLYAPSAGAVMGYIRAADGTFTTFTAGSSFSMAPVGINDDGVVAGSYHDETWHDMGFVYVP
jgi:hypothetical protein